MIRAATVAIGPITPDDLPHLLAWADDPDIARLNEPYLPRNPQQICDFWLNRGHEAGLVLFAIRAIPNPQILGYVQILGINAIHRSAVLGILIGHPANRHKGYGRQAMQLAIDYCWRHLNLRRLTLSVLESNTMAIALYLELGFVTEGVLQSVQFIDGRWVDIRLMALHNPAAR